METGWTSNDDPDSERGRLLSGSIRQKQNLRLSLKPIVEHRHKILLLMFAFVLLLFAFSKSGASSPVTLNPITPSLDVPVELQHTWAQYSPYFPVEKYVSPPRNCEITQVNIIQRHGARFPTTGATTRIKAAMAKLESVKHLTDPRLDFLRSFKYDLGADDLVPFGAAQSFDAGQEAFKRYVHLVGDDNLPFVRASSSERVVFSANNWTQGFAAASERRFAPVVSVVLDEAANDTLDDAMCPNASGSDAQTNAWLAVYAPPITDRLNKGAPGANLTDVDTYNLISLCPFETVFNEKKSPFCDLFESEPGAFSGFAYSGDLDKYYNTGYGQELGRIQGVGYVNELIARLTESPVRDNTQTNRTLDASPITFPLNRTIYADFSHDNQMIAIFAAIGLLKPARALDPTHPDPNRTWRAANLVPFSARMVVERLSCDEKEEKVRIFVNDALQPLEFCGAGKDGLCDLDAFVESQAYARNDGAGDFAKCFS